MDGVHGQTDKGHFEAVALRGEAHAVPIALRHADAIENLVGPVHVQGVVVLDNGVVLDRLRVDIDGRVREAHVHELVDVVPVDGLGQGDAEVQVLEQRAQFDCRRVRRVHSLGLVDVQRGA